MVAKTAAQIAIALDRRVSAIPGSRQISRHFNNLLMNGATNAFRLVAGHRIPDRLSVARSREPFQMHGDETLRPATKRILIVEDNELNMKLLRDVLEAYGYSTVTTGTGATALTLAREHRPDLILLDLQLPDISGFDALRRLKDDEETRNIPVVAVTAFAMVGDERKALMGGCDAYVAKPILLRNFLDLVERFIGGAGGPRQRAAATG